jgi:hypothetical protein
LTARAADETKAAAAVKGRWRRRLNGRNEVNLSLTIRKPQWGRVAAALVGLASAAQATLLVREGFDYAPGALDGTQTGGVGFAASHWGTGVSTYASVVSGLRYPGLSTSGRGAIKSTGWASSERPTAAAYGGGTFYMSMLLNANGRETGRLGFDLRNGNGPMFGRKDVGVKDQS